MLYKGDKVAIAVCSNAQPYTEQSKIERLTEKLKSVGLNPVMSKYIYGDSAVTGGSAEERAESLMSFYENSDIKAIFDISGGDISNGLLEYLDYGLIEKNYKPFFGYSDLTVILNALYAKTGKPSYLYQIKNIVSAYEEQQLERFNGSVMGNGDELYSFNFKFVLGEKMKGIVIGGNTRCFLKLSGTPFMPDLNGKILFLESRGGGVPQIMSYFSQLKQMEAFKKVSGVILGTFTELEAKNKQITAASLLLDILDEKNIPVAVTRDIGHGEDSKCLILGKEYVLN